MLVPIRHFSFWRNWIIYKRVKTSYLENWLRYRLGWPLILTRILTFYLVFHGKYSLKCIRKGVIWKIVKFSFLFFLFFFFESRHDIPLSLPLDFKSESFPFKAIRCLTSFINTDFKTVESTRTFCCLYLSKQNEFLSLKYQRFKVRLSPSKKFIFICFNETPLKMMKNAF